MWSLFDGRMNVCSWDGGSNEGFLAPGKHIEKAVVCHPLVSTSKSASTFSNDISETARPVETKLHVEPPWGGGTKVCS